ncbi:monovalent cation/proton antiporter, MnhG/PhaG subunit [Staphylothermus marinus F1]|uniref:Monovalent cation/proton antiporter, MnhG/PhaG subunit n=1 Tax=Staphylothermus marinus (strain ATCC 43588 / DSM 3639 / JCM 9404 / F1) TaxID=399550 RepID=A3DKH6_STAMF|nr:monovalent cation/H(+) antiporter subunit G [Staphylothermus marinus]ABN69136.1 monovalent cation/proton antiporter, MnhG/PhaG subunit [Staphylothermus marinus F1]
MFEDVLVVIGMIMIGIGAVADLIAAIGMNRFKNFYLRLHAATIGTIWGAFVPLIGASLIATGCGCLGIYRWFVAGGGLVTAILILILGPAGSHALARASHRSGIVRVEPCIIDQLDESMCVKESSRGGSE